MEQPSLNKAKAGAMRFNTDSSQLEIYDGNQWTGILGDSPEQQTGGTRAFRGGGDTQPTFNDTIEFFNLDTTGNASDFGNLTEARTSVGQGWASRTRGFIASGYNSGLGGYVNIIDFFTISSEGNASDFGDMVAKKQGIGALSSSTRGIINTGSDASSAVNVIQYVTMAQTGNAQDFGDLSTARSYARGVSNGTRGVNIGGYSTTNVIDFTTISTLGNAADFGDISVGARGGLAAASNAIRGIFSGGSPNNDEMSFLTIATLGDSLDFGDLTRNVADAGAAASPTRYAIFGGKTEPASQKSDEIAYVQIATKGDAIDFGNLTESINETAGCSNGHGGL